MKKQQFRNKFVKFVLNSISNLRAVILADSVNSFIRGKQALGAI